MSRDNLTDKQASDRYPAMVMRPCNTLGALATAYARHDRPDDALGTIDAALAVVNDTEERWS